MGSKSFREGKSNVPQPMHALIVQKINLFASVPGESIVSRVTPLQVKRV